MTTDRPLAWLRIADRYSPWREAAVVVAGLGTSGFAAADALLELGARVIVLDDLDSDENREKATLLEHLDAIEACHSIAGDAAYMLFVRVASPRALEDLVRDIRVAANVRTRTTVVLQSFYEHRPVLPVAG